ncbi:MAG: hypothetical protein Q9183_001594 [Haloplaca sp. 2 TL-2023]
MRLATYGRYQQNETRTARGLALCSSPPGLSACRNKAALPIFFLLKQLKSSLSKSPTIRLCMAESLAIAGTAVALISTATHLSNAVLKLPQKRYDLERIGLDVSLSLQKLSRWKENWSDQVDNVNLSAKTLWGNHGWSKIEALLKKIIRTSEELKPLLQELQAPLKSQAKLRWWRAMERISKKHQIDQRQRLHELATELSNAVDELWIYSETVFDARHGLLGRRGMFSVHQTLIGSALRSRTGSLWLYILCTTQTEDYNLDLDLLGNDPSWIDQSYQVGHSSAFNYPLVIEPVETQLKTWIVTDVEEINMTGGGLNDIHDFTKSISSDRSIFKPRTNVMIVKIPEQSPRSPHYLHIPPAPTDLVHLKSSPESLASILSAPVSDETSQSTSVGSQHVSLDRETRIKLAFTVARSGFFLLGTPWFCSLRSQNIRRCNDTASKVDSFILRTQTLKIRDLVSDDPGALEETSQLFRLGIILTGLAVGLDTDTRADCLERESTSISMLPQVERAMGASYCKATAFCLQYRTPRFFEPGKYHGEFRDRWETYLDGLLQDYHAQVYQR